MLFEVPIRYRSSGRKADNSADSTVTFGELISIEVDDVSSDEAPICVQWNDERPYGLSAPKSWYAISDTDITHVRYHAGDYWRPLSSYDLHKQDYLDVASNPDFYQVVKNALDHSGTTPESLYSKKLRRDDEYFEILNLSGRAEAIQQAEDGLKNILVVDGELYHRCLEPMIVVKSNLFEYNQNGRNVMTMGSTLRIATSMPEPDEVKSCAMFPLHKFREALTASRRGNSVNRNIKEYLNELNANRKPELYSEYFNNPDNSFVSECGIKLRQFLAVLEYQRTSKLPLTDRVKLRIYCDLADALDELPCESAFETIEIQGKRYLELYENKREWIFEEQVFLKEAIKAAEERPIYVPSEAHSLKL